MAIVQHSTGTWIREPDGANLLYYSTYFWNDPPTALKISRYGFYRAEYDTLPTGIVVPHDVRKLKPGEWIRIH